jgi:hypothetical protein
MDYATRKKIEKFKGLDFCCPGKQRMFCPKHMWEVPAFYRKKFKEFEKEFKQEPKVLTNDYVSATLF